MLVRASLGRIPCRGGTDAGHTNKSFASLVEIGDATPHFGFLTDWYKGGKFLGEGAFGKVSFFDVEPWCAVSKRSARGVALKVVTCRSSDNKIENDRAVNVALLEAIVQESLQHVNIARAFTGSKTFCS